MVSVAVIHFVDNGLRRTLMVLHVDDVVARHVDVVVADDDGDDDDGGRESSRSWWWAYAYRYHNSSRTAPPLSPSLWWCPEVMPIRCPHTTTPHVVPQTMTRQCSLRLHLSRARERRGLAQWQE